MKKILCFLAAATVLLSLAACDRGESEDEDLALLAEQSETTEKEDAAVTESSETMEKEIEAPQKEEAAAMRETVLEGMSDDEIEALCDFIKSADEWYEASVIYDNFFERLADPDSLTWNYFEKSGEIQIGWAYDGDLSMEDVMSEEELTENEFYQKYGSAVEIYNESSAEDFAQALERLKETVRNEALRDDLGQMIEEARQAAETHEVEHAEKLYYLLHDMDYYLLNYRLDTQGQYIQDNSTISKYYGVLSVYN